MAVKFHDHVKRSLVKTITYRLLIICSDSLIVYIVSHRWDITVGVVFFSNLASTVLYYVHERAWNKIHWGKGKKS